MPFVSECAVAAVEPHDPEHKGKAAPKLGPNRRGNEVKGKTTTFHKSMKANKNKANHQNNPSSQPSTKPCGGDSNAFGHLQRQELISNHEEQ